MAENNVSTRIKSIDTYYLSKSGAEYYFRSRLEAKWAYFFDEVGIDWEYEQEGYEFDRTRYLPDFWIPHLKLWVEIKGVLDWKTKKSRYGGFCYRYSNELDKCEKFRDAQEWPIVCVVGVPGKERNHFFGWWIGDSAGCIDTDYSVWCFSNGVFTLDVDPKKDRDYCSDNLMGIDLPLFRYPRMFGYEKTETIKKAKGKSNCYRFPPPPYR